jgi:hypothetical protein
MSEGKIKGFQLHRKEDVKRHFLKRKTNWPSLMGRDS